MGLDRRSVIGAGLTLTALAAAEPSHGATPTKMKLWPNGAPGLVDVHVTAKSIEEHENGGFGHVLSGVTEPTLSVHRPVQASDTAILVIPGGGFTSVWIDKEGDDICRWLAGAGIAAGAMTYRLPGDGWADKADAPLADAKRAACLLAKATGAKRIGVMGFSAGGTIAAAVATRWADPLYTAVDEADALDAKPRFMALGYPYLNVPAPPPARTTMHHGMTASSPPAFFFLAADDKRVQAENSLTGFRELSALKIPAALHVFENGGHGFALRAAKNSSAAKWPELFMTWAKAGGFVG